MLQDGKPRGTPVPLDRSGVSFSDIAFTAGGAVTADEAQRGYLAASSGDFVSAAHQGGLHTPQLIAWALQPVLCVAGLH